MINTSIKVIQKKTLLNFLKIISYIVDFFIICIEIRFINYLILVLNLNRKPFSIIKLITDPIWKFENKLFFKKLIKKGWIWRMIFFRILFIIQKIIDKKLYFIKKK